MFEANLFSWSTEFWTWIAQFEIVINFVILIIGLLIAFFKRRALIKWIFKKDQMPKDKEQVFDAETIKRADSCTGLILLLSREEQMSWLIDQVAPSYVTLVVSQQGAFKETAQKLQSKLLEKGMIAQVIILKDITDLADIKKTISQVIRNYKEDVVEHLIVDITGGTKLMSIGSYQAAKEHGEFVTYVSAPFEDVGKPILKKTQVISL